MDLTILLMIKSTVIFYQFITLTGCSPISIPIPEKPQFLFNTNTFTAVKPFQQPLNFVRYKPELKLSFSTSDIPQMPQIPLNQVFNPFIEHNKNYHDLHINKNNTSINILNSPTLDNKTEQEQDDRIVFPDNNIHNLTDKDFESTTLEPYATTDYTATDYTTETTDEYESTTVDSDLGLRIAVADNVAATLLG